MRDPFANYDQWLEEPYQRAIAEGDAFVDWAETNGYDLDDPSQVEEAEWDYADYMSNCEADHAEMQYESYLDRLEMEAEEREYEGDYY